MKPRYSLLIALAVILGMVAYTAPAFAADTAAKPAGTHHHHHKAAKAAVQQMNVDVNGKIETKEITTKKGKHIKVYVITVSSAKDADGKALDSFKDKELHIVGMKRAELLKFVGKDAEITGSAPKVDKPKRIRAKSIK